MFALALILSFVSLFFPAAASAHEAYVLPQDFFWKGIKAPADPKALAALHNTADLAILFQITGVVLLLIVLNFFFRRSRLGERVHRSFEKLAPIGPFVVRIAVATAFLFGAKQWEFLGPELSLYKMPFSAFLHFGLYASAILILLGLFTEFAALTGLALLSLAFATFGAYMGTYLNYLGEFIALTLFGMRRYSLDRLFFGPLKGWRAKYEKYGSSLVRIFYGLALIYAGVTVKFLHPELTLRVIQDWHLAQFHWLFPSDPLLIVLGGGLAEAAIGFFILVGFEVRMTVLISLFYITLSLLYFRELVWPHILLYGISFNLLFQPETFTLDHLLFERKRKKA